MCKKVYSDILPHFRVTSCLGARDILPSQKRDILLLACTLCLVAPWPMKSLKEARIDERERSEPHPNVERTWRHHT
jgi:hypothetical protein